MKTAADKKTEFHSRQQNIAVALSISGVSLGMARLELETELLRIVENAYYQGREDQIEIDAVTLRRNLAPHLNAVRFRGERGSRERDIHEAISSLSLACDLTLFPE